MILGIDFPAITFSRVVIGPKVWDRFSMAEELSAAKSRWPKLIY
jgi:hypothetical protein